MMVVIKAFILKYVTENNAWKLLRALRKFVGVCKDNNQVLGTLLFSFFIFTFIYLHKLLEMPKKKQKDFPELVVSVAGARFTHGHLERVSLVTSEISLRAAAERLQTYVMCASELNKAISGKNKFRAQI